MKTIIYRRCKQIALLMLAAFCMSQPAFAQEPQVITLTSSFNASGGVTLNAEGEIYVANFGDFLNFANGSQVYEVERDGSFFEFASGLQGASGNDFDSQGNLFQSNIAGNFISKIDTAGNVSTFASVNIFGPVGIAVAVNDTIYVANCRNSPNASIAKVTPNGASSIFVSSSLLDCPNGLTIDPDGNLYTCNFNNGRVIKITPDKTVSIFAEVPSTRCGHLTYANERLYVVGRCANQIFEVSLSGEVDTLAGSGLRGNDDGPASQATFNLPNGIAPSADGDTLFINDAVSLNGDCLTTPLNPIVVRMIVGVKSPTGIGDAPALVSENFVLEQNYPNPFNPSTAIRYILPRASTVTLKVFDVLGREVATLVDRKAQAAGEHRVMFNADKLGSGVYLYRLEAGNASQTRKMLLMN